MTLVVSLKSSAKEKAHAWRNAAAEAALALSTDR